MVTKTSNRMINGAPVNVKDFGAVGDGVADDADAIQSAIDTIGATGGTVYFPVGSYLLTKAVTTGMKGAILFRGEGRHDFKKDGSAGAAELIAPADSVCIDCGTASETNPSGASFINLGFRDKTGQSLGAIAVRRMSHTRFDNLCIKGFTKSDAIAINVDGTNDAGFLHEAHGVEIRDCATALRLINANATQWYGGFIADCVTGIKLMSPADELFFSGNIDNCNVGIDSLSDSLITSSMSRFEANDVAIRVERNNNKLDGFFNNNTIDVRIEASAVNTVIMGHRAVGDLVISDSASVNSVTRTRYLNKYGLVIPFIHAIEGYSLQRGTGIPHLTGDVYDYNPHRAPFWSIIADSPSTIYGIGRDVAGSTLYIANQGSTPITLAHDKLGTAKYRVLISGGDYEIPPNGVVGLIYDTAVSRWRVISKT